MVNAASPLREANHLRFTIFHSQFALDTNLPYSLRPAPTEVVPMPSVVLQTTLSKLPVRRGKVRDVYDLGDQLLLVSTDRISAFDYVLPGGVPDKGRVLTQLSAFWFDYLKVPNHMLSTEVADFGLDDRGLSDIDTGQLVGRSMLVRKTKVVPIECVVRGYLSGSGWKEYQKTQSVCGIPLPAGLTESAKLPEPIFTPATKEDSGHDINIAFERMVEIVGRETSEELRRRSIDIYRRGADYAARLGILIADTKFEWGRVDDELILIDEVLTPDSSRFWPADQYAPGCSPPSFDKQFVRDWLETTGWDKNSPPPELPAEVVANTRSKYIEAYERLTKRPFAWK
jgi:phosphoribosylaminoimidazole-succinocarboxamide synthase